MLKFSSFPPHKLKKFCLLQKCAKTETLYYQNVKIFIIIFLLIKYIFYGILINRVKIFHMYALRAMVIKPPHITNCVYAHVIPMMKTCGGLAHYTYNVILSLIL